MPIERIQIIITEEGGRRVKANIDDLGKSSTVSASGVERLKTALGQIGGASASVGAAAAQMNGLSAAMAQIASAHAGLGATITGAGAAVNALAASFENLSAAQQLASAQAAAFRASTGLGMITSAQEQVLAQHDLAQAIIASNAQMQNVASVHAGAGASIAGTTAVIQDQTVAWGQLTAAQQLAGAQAATARAATGFGMVTEAQQALLMQEQMGQARMRLMAALPGQYRAVGAAAATAAKQVETVAEANMRTARTFGVLGNRLFSIKTILGVLLVREVVNLTNAYQSLQNRIRVVTNNDQQLAEVTRELYDVAQRTRVGFEDTAETYARMAFNTRHLGLSQRELMQITETLNMALVVGGAKAQEGSNALIQLSQAFATGRLRADEFRAVTEQLPVVADALAKHFGVTRGELLKLSIEGKITVQEMIEAFREAAPEIEARFGKTIPTIEQSFVRLKNAMVITFGEIAKDSGTATALSTAVSGLVGNLERLKSVLQAIMLMLAIFVGVRGIQLLGHLMVVLGSNVMFTALRVADLVTKIKMLTTTLEGVFLLRAGIAAALAPLALLAETLAVMAAIGTIAIAIKLTIEEPKGMGKAILRFLMMRSLGGEFNAAGQAATVYGLQKITGELVKMSEVIDNFPELPKLELDMILPDLGEAIEKLDREYELLRMGNVERRVATELDKIRADLEPENRQLNKVEEAALRSRILKVIGQEELNNIIEQKKELEENLRILQLSGDARERESQLSQILKNTDMGVSAELRNQLSELIQQSIVRERMDEFRDILQNLAQENQLLKMNNAEREIAEDLMKAQADLGGMLLPIQMALIAAFLRSNQHLRDMDSLMEEINGPAEELEKKISLLKEALRDTKISATQFAAEMSKALGLNSPVEQMEALITRLNDIDRYIKETGGSLVEWSRMWADAFGLETFDIQFARFKLQMEGLQELLDKGGISMKEFTKIALELSVAMNRITDPNKNALGQFLQGAKAGFQELALEAYNFSANVADWIVGSFDAATEAIVEFARTGEFNIRKLASVIVEELLRLAIQQFIAQLIISLGGGALFGFQHGGSFEVQGSGGPDSQLVAFRASPGEKVDVTPPGKQQRQEYRSERPVQIGIVNVTDPRLVLSALQSVDGERVILNIIERNPSLVRRAVGAA